MDILRDLRFGVATYCLVEVIWGGKGKSRILQWVVSALCSRTEFGTELIGEVDTHTDSTYI